MINKLTFDTRECTGCRTCEVACSYHHEKIFCPSISSIEISEKTLGFTLSFYTDQMGEHLACDGCKGEEEPLCVKYCSVLMQDELLDLLKTNVIRSNTQEVQL